MPTINPQDPLKTASRAIRILLADDDKQVMESLCTPLRAEGFEVMEATDGLQALRLVRQFKPHLVIADILMPKLDGLKLTRLFKFDERFRQIPVIIISHISRTQDEKFLKKIGVTKSFSKPFQAQNVIETVKQLLKKDSHGK